MTPEEVFENVANSRRHPNPPTLATYIRSAGELWNHVLTAPVDDITSLHLTTAASTLTSLEVVNELLFATTDYSAHRHPGFENVRKITDDPGDPTLARMVWASTQVDWYTTPGMGNWIIVLGYMFTQHSAIQTAELALATGRDYACDEEFANSLYDLIEPFIEDVDDEYDADDDETYDVEDADETGWDDAGDEDWEDEDAETSWDEPFNTTEWEQRLAHPEVTEPLYEHPIDEEEPEEEERDITEPLPVYKPVLDQDDRTRRRRWFL